MRNIISIVALLLAFTSFGADVPDYTPISITETFLSGHSDPYVTEDFTQDVEDEKTFDAKGYLTLYHGQAGDGVLLYNLIKLLEGPKRNRTHYFRSSRDLSAVAETTTAEQFISSPEYNTALFEGERYPSPDMRPHVRNRVLSVSFTLVDTAGKESASHFLKSSSSVLTDEKFGWTNFAARQKPQKILRDIIESYRSDYDELDIDVLMYHYFKAINLLAQLHEKNGVMLNRKFTLRIKKDIQEHVLYLAVPGGMSVYAEGHPAVLSTFHQLATSNRFPSTTADINQLIDDGILIARNFDHKDVLRRFLGNPQGRLIVSHPLLNDEANFKVESSIFLNFRGNHLKNFKFNNQEMSVEEFAEHLLQDAARYLDEKRK